MRGANSVNIADLFYTFKTVKTNVDLYQNLIKLVFSLI